MNNQDNNGLLLINSKGIYDSDKHFVKPNTGLLIERDKIHSIGVFEDLKEKFSNARQMDLSSCYLFPGLINTHVHLEFNASDDPRSDFLAENDNIHFARAAKNANTMLKSGVTTARDAGSSWGLLNLNDPAVSDFVQLPRLQMAGPPITITGGHLHWIGVEADSVDELIKSVRMHWKRGCSAIKLMITGGQMTPGSNPESISYTPSQIQVVTEEATHLVLPSIAHCLTTTGFENANKGNINCIEHVACFKRNKENLLLERVYEPEVMENYRGENRYYMKGLSCMYHKLDPYRSGELKPTPREKFLLIQEQNMIDIFNKVMELGLTPVLGTDAGTPLTYFDETFLELELMVERCGLSNEQTIDIATINSAKCLGLGDVIGQLKEGFSADIIALKNNPIDDIHSYRKVEQVFCKGIRVTQ